MLQSRVQLKKEGVKTLKTNKNERKYPILIAYDTGSQYAVWCPYCFKWHFHGKKDGMRVAHCTNPHSPFKKLVILSSWLQEMIWISKVIISIQMTIQCLRKIKKMNGGM